MLIKSNEISITNDSLTIKMSISQSTTTRVNYDNVDNDEYAFDMESCSQKRQLIKLLNTTFPLVWLILGTFTNILSIIVFSRKSMRTKSTFIYLALMASTDLVVLLLGSMRDYLAYDYEIFINGVWFCRFHVFLFFLMCQFSSWLLVCANLDRFLIIIYHFRFKMWCTREIAIKTAITIFTILFLVNFHFLLFIDSSHLVVASSTSNTTSYVQINPIVYRDCIISEPKWYIKFYTTIYCWIDSFIFSFIPFFIIVICNLTLIRKVSTFKKKKNSRNSNMVNRYAQTNGITIQDGEETFMCNNATTLNGSIMKQNDSSSIKTKQSKSNINTNQTKNMAFTVMGVTALFIIFTVPINVYIPIMMMFSHDETNNVNTKCKEADLIFTILNNMVNGNHSINFFIYYFTNRRFKNEMNSILSNFKSNLIRLFGVVCSCCF